MLATTPAFCSCILVHKRKHNLQHAEHAEHVRVEQSADLGVRALFHPAFRHIPGVVDEDVDATANVSQHAVDLRSQLVVGGTDVEEEECVDTAILQLLELGGIASGGHHRVTACGCCQHELAAEAGRAARDQPHLGVHGRLHVGLDHDCMLRRWESNTNCSITSGMPTR